LAVLKLIYTGQLAGSGGRVGLALAGVLGAVYSLWALIGAGREAVLWGLALLAVAIPVYFLMRGNRNSPYGEQP